MSTIRRRIGKERTITEWYRHTMLRKYLRSWVSRETPVNIDRLKNRLIAKIITRFPSLAERFIDAYEPWKSADIPWTPVTKDLGESTVAVVTTAGVHHQDQEPFNMTDHDGDPSWRVIDLRRPLSSLMITHDYYDHADADRDINIVFPVERLKEFEQEGLIGRVADLHYGLMGHITGRHILTLIGTTAREIAGRLKSDKVDIVLLIPG
ncbi:MAG TPA: glycine/sarcosine/betaine reductase selenoprotein B family protein [Nitrospirota bacterium]|nr:glycine/sarcosine/betaine reductase selenoprotein B family protein [Nitrospirota bacterium]